MKDFLSWAVLCGIAQWLQGCDGSADALKRDRSDIKPRLQANRSVEIPSTVGKTSHQATVVVLT